MSLPPYYSDLRDARINNSYKNFDVRTNFDAFDLRARDIDSLNFVLDFGQSESWCAFDLGEASFKKLLDVETPASFDTRWINIWAPNAQTETLEHLAKKYDFSPRLTGLMRSKPPNRRSSAEFESHSTKSRERRRRFVTGQIGRKNPDVELQEIAKLSLQNRQPTDHLESVQNLNHYDVVDSIWHWSSVDIGPKYCCLGYNALYNVRAEDDGTQLSDLPNGKRVWNWLIICNDKTIISIVEDIKPSMTSTDVSPFRRNLLNIFDQLYEGDDPRPQNSMSLVPIRSAVDDDDLSASSQQRDRTGLLFYYLFDDWYSSYGLIARQEHQYGARLNRLLDQMMQQAQLCHISELHHIGRQLAVLQKLYQGYELMINRLLELQRIPLEPQLVAHSMPVSSITGSGLKSRPQDSLDQTGIYLTSAVRTRFERLRDRIRLYALSEIQECIDLKASLVQMNFNLITIKESDAVERLTRITILLAKVTILFLPVSLMTGYFSVSFGDTVTFSLAAYWAAFAIIFGLSFISLVLFGKLSGTVEGNMVYKSVGRAMWELSKRLFGQSKVKDGE